MVNLDDPEARALAERSPADALIGFGFDAPGATLTARNLELDARRRRASTLDVAGERHRRQRSPSPAATTP